MAVWRGARPVLAVGLAVVAVIVAYDFAASIIATATLALLLPPPVVCALMFLPEPRRAVAATLVAYGLVVVIFVFVFIYAAGHGT